MTGLLQQHPYKVTKKELADKQKQTNKSPLPLFIAVVGPTAVGKSRMAYKLAQWLGTEIISVDSRKMYKELNLGVARPCPEMLLRVKHHFIGHYSIQEEVSAGRFQEEARAVLQKAFAVYSHVIGVGGSGFYMQALCEGLAAMPSIPETVREKWRRLAQEGKRERLMDFLRERDPSYVSTADTQNLHRLARAAEVIEVSGRPYSSSPGSHKTPTFRTITVGLRMEKEALHKTIDDRVDDMMGRGLLQEVKALATLPECSLLWSTIGYKEFLGHLAGSYSLDEAVSLFKQNTKKYAKRQYTWFGRNKATRWFEAHDIQGIKTYLREKLTLC